MKMAWMRWLLAPLCTLAAAGLFALTHWPSGSYVPRAARVDRTPAATPGQASKKSKRKKPKSKPRSAEQREALWRRFKGSDITHEAVHARFKKENVPTVKRAATLARNAAFDGWEAEPILELESGCKTIRCFVTYCAEHEEARDEFAAAFERARYRGNPIWRGLEFETAESKDDLPCERAVFGMSRRRPEPKFIKIAPESDTGTDG